MIDLVVDVVEIFNTFVQFLNICLSENNIKNSKDNYTNKKVSNKATKRKVVSGKCFLLLYTVGVSKICK